MRLGRLAALAWLLGVCGAAQAEPWRLVNGKSFYPEGPLWHDGRLHYVEYSSHTVMVWDGKDNRELWRQDGCGPAALAPYRDGLLVTCYDAGTLVLISAEGQTREVIDRDREGRRLLGPNDLAEDGKGGLYVSMSGVYDLAAPVQGEVHHLDAAGVLRTLADDIHYSNGLALADGGRTLLVAEMLAARVLRFDVAPDGSLSRRTVFLRLEDIVPDPPDADAYYGPDGLKVGRDGTVYVAQNGGGAVLATDPTGKTLKRRLPVGAKYVTNVAFGADETTLYVTAAIDAWKAPFPGAVYEVDNR